MKKKKRTGIHPALKYSGMAFQMAGSIFFGWWLGGKIDSYLGYDEQPIFSVLLMLVFLSVYFYVLVKQVSEDK